MSSRGVGGSRYCCICGCLTGFFIWTSSRNFPRMKVMDKLNLKPSKSTINRFKDGDTVCLSCYNDLKEN